MNKQSLIAGIILFFFATALALSFTSSRVYAVKTFKCTEAKPSDTPRFKRMDAKKTSVKLYFSSVAQNNTLYIISYGYWAGDERFGVEFPFDARSKGWIKYKINSLEPGKTYYFKVRGGNGCKPGNWSDWKKVTTPKSGVTITRF